MTSFNKTLLAIALLFVSLITPVQGIVDNPYHGYFYFGFSTTNQTGWILEAPPYLVNSTTNGEFSFRNIICNSTLVNSSLEFGTQAGCSEAYFYNSSSKSWFHWDTSVPDSQNNLTAMKVGYGYWVNVTNVGRSNPIYGNTPWVSYNPPGYYSQNYIHAKNLKPGWNLVGCDNLTLCGAMLYQDILSFIAGIKQNWNVTIDSIWDYSLVKDTIYTNPGNNNINVNTMNNNDMIHQIYPADTSSAHYLSYVGGYWFCVRNASDPNYCLREAPPLMPWQNQRPVISNPSILGDNNNDTKTQFAFQIKYRDFDGDIPQIAHLYVDDIPYNVAGPLTLNSSYAGGVNYTFISNFSVGKHYYYFLFDDGKNHTYMQRDPWNGSNYNFEVNYPGPTVFTPSTYVAAHNGATPVYRAALKAINNVTGIKLWEFHFPLDTELHGSPAIYKGIIYIGTPSGKMYAIYAKNGTQKWVYDIGINNNGNIYGTALARSDGVYFQSYKGLYALNLDGTLKWVRSDLRGDMPLASSTDKIFVATGTGDKKPGLYGLSASGGSTSWVKYDTVTFNDSDGTPFTAYRSFATPAFSTNVYSIRYGNLTAYADDGMFKWTNGSDNKTSIAFSNVVASGSVYATGWENYINYYLYSFDSVGKPNWKSAAFTETYVAENGKTYPVAPSTPTIYSGAAYVTVGNALYSIKIADGSLNWKKTFADQISGPAVMGYGLLLVNTGGQLVVIDISGNQISSIAGSGNPIICDRTCFIIPGLTSTSITPMSVLQPKPVSTITNFVNAIKDVPKSITPTNMLVKNTPATKAVVTTQTAAKPTVQAMPAVDPRAAFWDRKARQMA